MVGTLGGGPIGTAVGGIVGGIGGAIGGEAFTEWLYDQKDAICGFFSNTLPKVRKLQVQIAAARATETTQQEPADCPGAVNCMSLFVSYPESGRPHCG